MWYLFYKPQSPEPRSPKTLHPEALKPEACSHDGDDGCWCRCAYKNGAIGPVWCYRWTYRISQTPVSGSMLRHRMN